MSDYYSFTSFFTGIVRKPGAEARDVRIFVNPKLPPARHLVDGRPMPAKVLGGAEAAPEGSDPRQVLAAWLTSPQNELFTHNLANRIWAHYLGRGVIEPVDDVRASNPPVNGPLLDALAAHLVASKFSLRSLVRDICNSRVYQLSAAHLRRLRADVLLDSFVAVSAVPTRLAGFPEGTRAIDFYPRSEGATEGPHYGDAFFETFGRSPRDSICACATKREPTLSQTLHMIVGNTVNGRLTANGQINRMVRSQTSPEATIETLFIRVLSRKPKPEEMSDMRALVGERTADFEVYQDIFWSLLNSTEFSFNY
jgi:hypothetical protein